MKSIRFRAIVALLLTAIVLESGMYSPASAASYSCVRSLEELEAIFPEGKYWNHIGIMCWDMTTTTDSPCTHHSSCTYSGSCGCNSYKGKATQCMGFAYSLQDLAFNGFDGYDAEENWNYTDAMSRLKAGDVIRYRNGQYNHSIFVTDVDGTTITFMDCNGTGGTCAIRHDESIEKRDLKNVFLYVTHAPAELTSNEAERIDLFETAIVTAKLPLTIRARPDINSEKIGYLDQGTIVQVYNYPLTDNSGYTWRLLMNDQGWVCGDYLNITKGISVVSGNYRIQGENGKYLSYTTTPANDVNIVMYDDLSDTSLADLQVWNFQPLFAFSDWGAVIYRITPASDPNYSLDCDSSNNELLHLWNTLDIGAQKWIVEVRGDGSLRIRNYSTRYALDVYSGETENNTDVITYPSHDGSNQKFYLVAP